MIYPRFCVLYPPRPPFVPRARGPDGEKSPPNLGGPSRSRHAAGATDSLSMGMSKITLSGVALRVTPSP